MVGARRSGMVAKGKLRTPTGSDHKDLLSTMRNPRPSARGI
jgi:hypothetical protein